MKLGFIGTGVMGNAIASNLQKAGYELWVYNRTKAKTDNLVAAGATWCATPQEVTEKTDIIFTMLGFPQDVEQVYYDSQGIFQADVQNKILVDMTTSKPQLAQRIFQTGQKKGAQVLDAPVSGGDIGAKNGTLTIMVGGQQATFDKLQPLFQAVSSKAQLFGPAGAGQNTKMANQIMIAGTMTGMSEMLVYAKAAGLDLNKVLETVGAGSAANWSLTNYGPRILKGDYNPGFFSKHFLKDLRIALDTAAEMKIDLPATKQAKELYEKLVDDKKLGDLGTQALVKLWW
ncbi:3-hydroxyisobutyrate dehydrogenase [Bombilactobacillus mellis]|uniref:3-hydroxyisobutyrate dehydrogenase n=1 Tax=Bombilactobacillus mellis TaxID=1218508 RepID=A0A0F4KNG7_9LACO|nr:NAD(P)-dependent oxidoreductase [Bombilactobacillus mellis]KJY48217.1 3-hydroxyisobutyrate dehydrogenase [Bombilactobacillus mellis]MCT6841276.1 NAD(P)-dependent oxidoreductase [Bombilactobacillus mellis]MCT6857559.1 NAD(P)-dependent oxidoreductase [Bombilactobacillus mellis]MCT6873145.1 NAD(P)-dependent oxidoreductase [Bombilactobacillus mellis]MCX0278912.1 NAD(P)-dependent oxidoreductase [Bombilactobacillus mellis]